MKLRFLTDADEMEQRWIDVARLLAPVVTHAAKGEFTLADIRDLAHARLLHIGIADDEDGPVLALAFEFKHYPRFTAVNIVALGGQNLAAANAQFLDDFRAWAKQAGAECIEASCSEAMTRMLKKHGFTDTYRQVRLPV